MEGGATSAIRQRMTLSDQLAVIHSVNLRDLLKVGDVDDNNARRGRRGGAVTLATVLQADKKTTNSASASASTSTSNGGGGRTLLDAMREDEDEDEDEDSSNERGGGDLRDGMEFGSRDESWDDESTTRSRSRSDRRRSSSGAGTRRVRVSLMTLMELRENWEEEEEEDKMDEKREEQQQQEQVYCCVVCMVREKGAAFIPCGHTFCRICSRHLLMARRNCPLCNASILDVLHIF